MIAGLLLILLPVMIEGRYGRMNRETDSVQHRVFPAAKVESYNPDNLQQVLGVLSSGDEISFVTSFTNVTSSNKGQNGTRNYDKFDRILKLALERFRYCLKRYPDFSSDYPVNPKGLPLVPIETSFRIEVNSSDVELYHGVPEDYEIHAYVSPRTDGENVQEGNRGQNISNFNQTSCIISLKASTVFGVLRAIETLGQLLEFGWMDKNCGDDQVGVYVIRDLPLQIVDEPAFPYRGLMIDTARHYLPMDLILDNLDAMAMNKMNVLHWHISDKQSFPYAPTNMSELAKGAYHPKRIYTPQDVHTIVREAYLRGIRVIPEIDMPGHTNAIAASHPEIMSHCPDPSEPMNPTVNETWHFVANIYKDLDAMFPDWFVHVGGDEVWMSEACWLQDPSIAIWMKDHGMEETVELYEYFETKLLFIVDQFCKTPIVWQEVFDLNLTIPKNTVVDVWKGFDKYSIQNATNQGYRVILSGCWYLDHLKETWQSFYECDPLNFTSSNKDLMIGGHASMWGEHCDASNFISRVWPRASSAAEKLWHGTSKSAASTIAERISNFRCRMVQMGFAAGPTGPGVCPTEVAYSTPRRGTAKQSCRSSTEAMEATEL